MRGWIELSSKHCPQLSLSFFNFGCKATTDVMLFLFVFVYQLPANQYYIQAPPIRTICGAGCLFYLLRKRKEKHHDDFSYDCNKLKVF